MDVRSSYDSAATAYADHLFAELYQKPLDRHLLGRFVEGVFGRGLVADLGCGPGHVAKYLAERGVDACGIDLSPEMIRCARRLCPGVQFNVGDMRCLDLARSSLAGIVAFYSIVHFAPSELGAVFAESRRVLMPGGVMLLAFHIGDDLLHLDELFGQPISLDFHFHQTELVVSKLKAARIVVTETSEREPYDGVEYPSRRCYLFGRAV